MRPRLGLIVARDSNYGIGRAGGIPWRSSIDLRFARSVTLGHALLMGRKTWESIPKRPLDRRLSVVLSSALLEPFEETHHSQPFPHPTAVGVGGLEEAWEFLESYPLPLPMVWVFGGAGLYNAPEIRQEVSEIYETSIPGDFGCDVFLDDWEGFISDYTPVWMKPVEDSGMEIRIKHYVLREPFQRP